jgi:predicted ABC-type ATPase
LKSIVILGGPNGAGKTTAARALLPERLPLDVFLNADEIARGISPSLTEVAAIRAGRLMLEGMQERIHNGHSFAFETTCAGKSYLKLLRDCRADGWTVSLLFLWLPSPEACMLRVAQRVSFGGHPIPADVIRRRYWAGLHNLHKFYIPLADAVRIYDNSDSAPRLVAEKNATNQMLIHDSMVWAKICEASNG